MSDPIAPASHASRAAAELPPPVLPDIPGYRLISELGSGGTSRVYLAIQDSIGRKVALKVSNQSSSDMAAVERFVREAKIMSRLSHPYIVAVHDVGQAGDWHYIAMEYLGGGSLKQRIRKRGMDIGDAVRIIAQITQALDFAHDKGFLHRDIKPGNILFRHDGSAVLTDFGIARPTSLGALSSAATPSLPASVSATVVGTPRYMSPEQAKGKSLDRRSDLYSVGILMFELLTGRVPFDGDDALDIGIKHLKARVPLLPPSLASYQLVLEKLLAKDPNQRFQRGQPLIDALYRIPLPAANAHGKADDTGTIVLPSGPNRLTLVLLVTLTVLLLIVALAQFSQRLPGLNLQSLQATTWMQAAAQQMHEPK